MLMVSEHISKQQNSLTNRNDMLSTIELSIKKNFDSNIFVQFLPLRITEEQVIEKFSQAGDIVSVKLVQKADYSSYRSAYVLYENVEQAKRAIQLFHESAEFGGKPMKVDFWMSKHEREQEKRQRDMNELKFLFDFLSR